MRPLFVSLLVAAALTGCGDRSDITGGGVVDGDALTVYVLVPFTGEGRSLVRGAKLALAEAHGEAGRFTVQIAALPEPPETEGVADAVRDAVKHEDVIAILGDIDERTAQITGPLVNAAGLLHVSPLPPGTRVEQPAARGTFFPVGPDERDRAAAIVAAARPPIAVEAEPGGEALADAIRAAAGRTVPTRRARTVVYAGTDPVNAQGVIEAVRRENPRARIIRSTDVRGAPPPGFAAAFPGVAPGPYARSGYDAMGAILAALRRAGQDAPDRTAVLDAFRPPAATPLSVRG